MKRALVLAGGGARGAFQVGMLHELVINQGLDFHFIRGVSVGALNAAFLAQAASAPDSLLELKKQVEALEALWTAEIRGDASVYESRALGVATVAVGADSLYSTAPLRKLIDKHVSLERLRSSGRDFAVGAVSLVTGRYQEYGPRDPRFIERLLASAAIPVVFPFVEFEDESNVLVDGGTRNITPLGSVFRGKVDEIYVLLTSRLLRTGERLPDSTVKEDEYARWKDNPLGTKVSALDVLRRALAILTDEIYLTDLQGALDWNRVGELAARAPELRALMRDLKKRVTPLFILAPREWFGESNAATDFQPGLIRSAIEHGLAVARDRSRWVWPPL